MSMPRDDSSPYVRMLCVADWAAFRAVRLHALETEPAVFARRYADEAAVEPDQWQRLISGPGSHVVGLFVERLAGIAAVFPWDADPDGRTALFAMAYIVPEQRGRGLSRLLYEARFKQTSEDGRYDAVVVSHRRGNEVLRRLHQAYGFAFLTSQERVWPDGTRADEVFLKCSLRSEKFVV